MTGPNRQKLLLALLAVVLLFVVGRQLAPRMSGGASSRASSPVVRSSRNTGKASSSDAPPQVVELRLSDLERAAGTYRPGRDPFDFKREEPRQPKPVPKPDEEARRKALAARAKAEQAAAPAAPPKPKPPPVDVVFLGSFGPERRRLGVFSDGSDIFNVLQGDVLKDKFVVVKIGYETADLGFVGFPDAPAQRLEIGG
jgi:hypothetical protein